MKAFPLLLCALIAAGCTLAKEESSLDRADRAAAGKTVPPPPGSFTEERMGVRYYPGAEQVQSREYDEGGMHILEVGLSTRDSADQVGAFYEKELGAKASSMGSQIFRVVRTDAQRQTDVSYGRFDAETTITIKVATPSRIGR